MKSRNARNAETIISTQRDLIELGATGDLPRLSVGHVGNATAMEIADV